MDPESKLERNSQPTLPGPAGDERQPPRCESIRRMRTSIVLAGFLLSLVGAGWLVSDAFQRLGETQGRERIRDLALCAAVSLAPQQVAALTGTPSDRDMEDFRRLKDQLAAIHHASRKLRFVYLLGKKDGQVIFLADAEPENSPDYSVPGDPYPEASPELVRALDTGDFFVEGPFRDRWGKWVSAHAPILDPGTGRILAMIGMDIDSGVWRAAMQPYRWLGAGLTVFLALTGVAATLHLVRVVCLNKCLSEQVRHCTLAEAELQEEHTALQLRESEIRSIMNNTPDVIYRLDREGNFVFISDAIRRYGYTPQALAGKPMLDLVHPEDRAAAERHLCERRTGDRSRKRCELRMFAADESTVSTEIHSVGFEGSHSFVISAEGLYFSDKPCIETFVGTQGVARDITERKMADKERARLAMAIEQAEETIMITDIEGCIQYVNPAFERLTGYARQEILGKKPNFLKSGKQDDNFYREMWAILRRGEVWRGHLINRKKDGSLFNEEASISPVRDAQGNIANFVGVKRDVTRELQLEVQLRQAQKMEAIGTLAGGIAHDFNNILGAILGYTQLAMDEVPQDGKARRYLGEIERAGLRAAELVQQILSFGRKTEQERRPMSLLLVVEESLRLLRGTLPATIEIRKDVECVGARILGDPAQMHQVVMNLCTNAFHAMEENGGTLTVTLAQLDGAAEFPAAQSALPHGKYLRLGIADTGHGMNESTLQRIFEPYFTTKPVGKGTGMGLATVHGIIKSHGGAIDVSSRLGVGTEFVIRLPVSHETKEARQSENLVTPPRGRGEHILFIDDEIPVLHANAQMLERVGYRVTALSSPLEALDVFQRNPMAFDVIVTDHTMPKKTGTDLAVDLLSIRGRMPIILTTGLNDTNAAEKARLAGIREVLGKPTTLMELSIAVRRALDEKVEPTSAARG